MVGTKPFDSAEVKDPHGNNLENLRKERQKLIAKHGNDLVSNPTAQLELGYLTARIREEEQRSRSEKQAATGSWVRLETQTGRFMDQKTSTKTPFKGGRREK